MFHVRSSGIEPGEDAELIQFEEGWRGFRDISLARRKFAYVPPPPPPPFGSASLIPQGRWTHSGKLHRWLLQNLRKTLSSSLSFPSPSRSLFSFFFSFFLLFFFLYLLPAERPRVINQIIRWVRLDFCLATFEFGSRGFDDEGKDCCGGVDLPSFLLLLPSPLPSSRHTGSFPLSFVYVWRCVAAWW